MEILKETQLENGDYLWEVEYTEEEFDIFKTYMKNKGHEVDKMPANKIMEGAIIEILKDQIEKEERKEENEQNGNEKAD